MRGKRIRRIVSLHIFADVAKQAVGKLVPVNAVDVFEIIQIVKVKTVPPAGVFGDPFFDAFVKPRGVVNAREGIDFAGYQLCYVFGEYYNALFRFVLIFERNAYVNAVAVRVGYVEIRFVSAAVFQFAFQRFERQLPERGFRLIAT